MSAYESERMRDIAKGIANGECNHAWPWDLAIATYLGVERDDLCGSRRPQGPHFVMACLLASHLAGLNRRGNWMDYRAKQFPAEDTKEPK